MPNNDFDAGTNFGEDMPAFPIDANGRSPAIVFGAVVTTGAVVKYLPLKCTDNGDGTATLNVV